MQFNEFKNEGIVDKAVIFHNTLNPRLWQGDTLRPKIRYKLLQIAKHFIDFIDIPEIMLQDITISGSNAAYTYTANSDIDLHLICTIPAGHEDHMSQLFDAKKNQYNFDHDIKIKGIDVEVYVQKAGDVHHSAGIYSVLDNVWLEKPTPVQVNIDDDDVTQKVESYASKIKLALQSNDINDATKISDEIYKLRKVGLERSGEFSVENIAFKVLRAEGLINMLRQHRYNLEDQALSLEHTNENQSSN